MKQIKMKLLEKIKYEINDFKEDIKFYLDLDKPYLDSIPGIKSEKKIKSIPPLVQLSNKGKGGRIRMKR